MPNRYNVLKNFQRCLPYYLEELRLHYDNVSYVKCITNTFAILKKSISIHSMITY